jgi:hypothetical protein
MLFFGAREPIRNLFPHSDSMWETVASDFVCGAMLGALISTICFPINGKPN